MKHPILNLVTFLFCASLFAQEASTCLFIGTYQKTKRGICGDYELVHETVADYAEFVVKRIAFENEHRTKSPNTRFINASESVIAFQYEKKVSGWNCNSSVISTRTGKSVEECNRLMAEQVAKYPKDFTTQPKLIFSWEGKGENDTKKNKTTIKYFKDYGGLTGHFTAANLSSKSIIVAQLSNKTIDKLAYVKLKTDNGTETVEYIKPNETLTKKYDTTNLEITVIYLKSTEKPTESLFNTVKNKIRETIINENGKIKPVPTATTTGVRG